MPFRALYDGEIVTPIEVADQQPVECLECRGVLYPREGEDRARHFFHAGDVGPDSCVSAGGGESDTHARCTALAVEALSDVYPDAVQVGSEVVIDVSSTLTTPSTRRADALVEFQEENRYFGNGIIIEVQYKNYSKDIESTTHDYLSAGLSVAWLTPGDFGSDSLSYDVVEDAFKTDEERGYSVLECNPWEFEPSVGTDFEWEPQATKCWVYEVFGEHRWVRVPRYAHPNGYEYEICRCCEIRRQYDKDLTRFVYDHQGVLSPNLRPAVLRDAVIPYPDVAEDFDEWLIGKGGNANRTVDKAIACRQDVAPCRGPLGIHEWDRAEAVERNYDDSAVVELWECRYCPVHLLTNHTGLIETEAFILFGKGPDPDWGLDHLNGNPRQCSNRSHNDSQDWDYCPDCFQLTP